MTLLCYVRFNKKNNSFLSFHSPIFHSKIMNVVETFFETRGNSVKRTYVDGGRTCKKEQGQTMGEGGQKLKISSERTF